MVSIQAAAAPVKMSEDKLCQKYKHMLTRDCDGIKVCEGDSVFVPETKGVLNIEICWCSSRTIKCLDCLSFGIVKETKCIPNFQLRAIRNYNYRLTNPPIPQQLGSVTFRAADTATAASAIQYDKYENLNMDSD